MSTLREALQTLSERLAAKAFPLTPHDTAESCITLCDLQDECRTLAEAALRADTPTPPLEDQSLDDALDARSSLEGTLTAIVVRLNCAQKVRDLTEAEEEILQMARESFQPRAETPSPREAQILLLPRKEFDKLGDGYVRLSDVLAILRATER